MAEQKPQSVSKEAAQDVAHDAPEELHYRLTQPHIRAGKTLPAGTLVNPSPREMACFLDRFERVATMEEVVAEKKAQLEAAAADLKKQQDELKEIAA